MGEGPLLGAMRRPLCVQRADLVFAPHSKAYDVVPTAAPLGLGTSFAPQPDLNTGSPARRRLGASSGLPTNVLVYSLSSFSAMTNKCLAWLMITRIPSWP